MKKILFILLGLTFFSCSVKEKKSDKITIKKENNFFKKNIDQEQEYYEGVISLEPYLTYKKGTTLKIFNKDSTVYAEVSNGNLIIKGISIDLYEIEEHEFNTYINSIAFYPDYSTWYIMTKKEGDFYKIETKDGVKFINLGDATFLKYATFLKKQWIGLNTKSPLRKNIGNTSEIIKDYINYDYQVIEVKGDWIKLKLSDITPPGEESYKELGLKREGWVKWREGKDILIKFYYDI